MGLTRNSTGRQSDPSSLILKNRIPGEKLIAVAGNPNVGKSTLFNGLTGMNQHTGNWPGKTVSCATGRCHTALNSFLLVDLPGTYSLMAHSPEEEIARDFLCFGDADAALVICDATCLERGLNLVFQTLELIPRVLVCVNLMDEAARRHIQIDLGELSSSLGVPVIGTSANQKQSLLTLANALDLLMDSPGSSPACPVVYPAPLESALQILSPVLHQKAGGRLPIRWLALRSLENNPVLNQKISDFLHIDFETDATLNEALAESWKVLQAAGIQKGQLSDAITTSLFHQSEVVCQHTLSHAPSSPTGPAAGSSLRMLWQQKHNRRIRPERLLTNRYTAYPMMLLMLAFIFWLTIAGANLPSRLLSKLLFSLQDRLTELFLWLHAPDWLHGALVLGAYRVLAWVVSVMLPPMAIFFPLFTLLEDAGLLPQIAYNLDHGFQRCGSCGKQALTMCIVYINL